MRARDHRPRRRRLRERQPSQALIARADPARCRLQGCLPGSHRDSYQRPTHPDWQLPPWDERVPVRRVEGNAGDIVLFSEKLSHTTVPWSGAGERRTVFYVSQHSLNARPGA